MHNPGICGVILGRGLREPGGNWREDGWAQALDERIDALTDDTEMVLVAASAADGELLAPVVWAKAAYLVEIPADASEAETLRIILQDVMSRGRDAALVTGLAGAPLSAEMAHRMVADFCAAGDDIWAVATDSGVSAGQPLLLGRRMIELFLRGRSWTSAEEALTANRQHVSVIGKQATASEAQGA
jgi:hypothetical protein